MKTNGDLLGDVCRLLLLTSPSIEAAGVFDGEAWVCAVPDASAFDAEDPSLGLNLKGEMSDEVRAAAQSAIDNALRHNKRLEYLESEVVVLDRMEQELRRREIELSHLVDGAPIAIFVVDLDGCIQFVNRHVERLLDCDREDMIGSNGSDRHELFDLSEVFPELLDQNCNVQRERTLTFGGKSLSLLEDAFALRGPDGEVQGVCVVSQDISARRASVIALEQSERNYREIFDLSTDLIVVHEIETGEVIDVNGRVLEALGYEPSEWIGKAGWMSGAVDMGENIDISLNLVHEAAEHPVTLEWPLRHQDGSVRWFELKLTRTTISGTPRVLVLGRDIQRRKVEAHHRALLEEDIRRSQKFDALGRLAGGVAAEFGSLIGVILAASENMRRQDPEGQWVDLPAIQEAASKAAHLTRKLTTMGKRGVTKPREVDLSEAVSSISELLQKALGPEVVFDLHLEPTPKVVIDPALLDQALVNLTVHSREAMGTKGHFVIETKVVDAPDDVKFRDIEQVVRLRVSDSGASIHAEDLDNVFEPFFSRTGTAETEASQGLGLAMVHSVIDAAGGIVEALCDETGVHFDLYIPMTLGNTIDRPGRPPGAPNILIVEDEPGVLASVKRILESRGYQIVTATNAEDALSLLDEDPTVDLMLTDVVMPGLSGPELAAKVRQTRPEFAVLYMSGYPDNVIGPDVSDEGSSDLLLKPFTARSLIRAVEGRLASVL